MGLKSWFTNNILEKFNRAQAEISRDEGDVVYADSAYAYSQAYDSLPVVRRGVDLLVNACASFDTDVLNTIPGITSVAKGLRKTKVNSLLNHQPNLYLDVNKFRRLLYMDLVLQGNAFLYWDGAYLYNLPAEHVEIITDPLTYIRGYRYNNVTEFSGDEVIHISDGSSSSIYKGTSRLKSTAETLATRGSMVTFQKNFFTNGAVPGLVLKSPNVLGDKIKARMIESWIREYSTTKGARRPVILDGGLEIDQLGNTDFKELDFQSSIKAKDQEILLSLGVPSILLDGGNNANISPNLRMFYLETVIPLVRAVNSALERFTGYDLSFVTNEVSSMQPDLKDTATYHSTLVNGGILAPNEAREALRYQPKPGNDDLRVPANIAGSAAGAPGGGAPKKDEEKPNADKQKV